MFCTNRNARLETQRIEFCRQRLVLVVINLINYEHDRFLRFAQCARQVFIDRRQAFFCIDNEQYKIALAQRFFCGEAYLGAQLASADAEDSAGIPHCEWACAAIANCRNPVACDSRLIMNNSDLSTDQAIEQGGLTHVWPTDDRDIWQRARLIHYRRPHLRFRWMRMACSLPLPDAICDVNDPGDRSEKASRDHKDREPGRKAAVIGVELAPVANA